MREITLLGQNVNAWHGDGPDGRGGASAGCSSASPKSPASTGCATPPAIPRDMDDDLIAAHRDLAALMPYLHLPVQSGSDRMLAAMNRRHRRADYLRLIDRIRAARPDIAFAGDFIVGFPGESDADFDETLSIVEEVGYAAAFSFKYSPRPGTPAARMPTRFPNEIKTERLQRLQALHRRPSRRAFNRSRVGTTADSAVRAAGPPSRPDRRPLALAAAGPRRGATRR